MAAATPAASDDWCEPAYPPIDAFGPDAAEFRADIIAEYEAYLIDARLYIDCLERERRRVFREVEIQANEYARFLSVVKREDQ